jgi:hypothetical protein
VPVPVAGRVVLLSPRPSNHHSTSMRKPQREITSFLKRDAIDWRPLEWVTFLRNALAEIALTLNLE